MKSSELQMGQYFRFLLPTDVISIHPPFLCKGDFFDAGYCDDPIKLYGDENVTLTEGSREPYEVLMECAYYRRKLTQDELDYMPEDVILVAIKWGSVDEHCGMRQIMFNQECEAINSRIREDQS